MGVITEFFGAILGPIMRWSYLILRDYGLALFVFTFLTRAILFPLSIKQQKSTAKMAIFQPKIAEIQKKYANNKEKQQQELMKLYEEEKFNPMAGCLPMLIQFPLLFGLINVVYNPLTHILKIGKETVAAAGEIAKTVLNITSNATTMQTSIITAFHQNPDAFASMGSDFVQKLQGFDFTFFGMDLGVTPSFGINWYILIPILSGVTSFLAMWISMRFSMQANESAQQAAGMTKGMLFIMPLFSLFIAFSFPIGVGLYWIFSNLLMMVQSVLLNKMYNPKKMREQAMQEAAKREELKKLQRQQARQRQIEKNGGKTDEPLEEQEQEENETDAQVDKPVNNAGLSDSQIIAAARKRMAQKYGDEYTEE